MRWERAQRIEASPRRCLVWAILGLGAAGVLAALLFAGVCIMGRGTRAAIGVTRQAQSSGVRIVYHEHGSGESVVLLASLARPASDFNELASALGRDGFRTLAIESRGVGGSEGGGPLASFGLHDLASDVNAVLRKSGLREDDRVHVVGHAFGNRVARTFATDYPSRVGSVTLIAAGGRVPITPRIGRALLTSTFSFLPWSLRGPELRLAFFSAGSEIPEHWRTGWWLWGGVAQMRAAEAADSSEFWSAGVAPMLVLQASDDRIAPPADAGLALRAEFPERVTLVEIPRAGHALLPEQAGRIEESIITFLRLHRFEQ